jgi:hypothetical protein
MDSIIFRAALRASAKVALTATLGSCGGVIRSPAGDGPEGGSPPPVSTASVEDASPEDASDEPPIAALDSPEQALADVDASPRASCNPPAPADLFPESAHRDAGVGQALFDCCVAVLGTELAPEGGVSSAMLSDAAAHDPTVLGCCAVAVAGLDSTYGDSDAGRHAQAELAAVGVDIFACCSGLDWPSGPTCTAWGPPMPRAMLEVA